MVLSQSKRVSDRHTDGQTDRIVNLKTPPA